MLNAGQFTLSQEKEFFSACRVLFGSDIEVNRDFLTYLQLEGIRQAYLNLAKTTHPDRFPGADLLLLRRKAESFSRVTGAYGTLSAFIKARSKGVFFTAGDRFGKVSQPMKDFVVSPRSQPAGRGKLQRGRRGVFFFVSLRQFAPAAAAAGVFSLLSGLYQLSGFVPGSGLAEEPAAAVR